MKKFKAIFSSIHNIYRLTTSSTNIKNFLVGSCRIYKNALNTSQVTMICKHINSQPFLRVRLDGNDCSVKKGTISILTPQEKDFFEKETEILDEYRMAHVFIFMETIGLVYIKRSPGEEPFTELQKRWFVSLSEVMTSSLRIFQMYKEEHKTVMNSIKSLTNMLKQYDATSYLHTKSISPLIKAMSKEMRLTEIQSRSLEYASMLHDAGAIPLSGNILSKSDSLTYDEYQTIMKHPKEGVELIKNLEFLRPAIPIILHHHERYNGTGYPNGLKKDQIPIGARILAVLDAFDAMYFGRPYKEKKSLAEIEAEFTKEKGKQFDPKVIDCFLKIIKRKNIQNFLGSRNK